MNGSFKTICPAKLNLFLAVGPPDPKGWHPLRTVFQAIDFHDELWVALSDQDSFECQAVDLPRQNTVTRALAAFRQAHPTPPVTVRLVKNIPSQSGLGGGSSDGAAMLRTLDRLTGRAVSREELMRIALQVGADVPFFLVGGRASAEGYGEKLTELPDAEEEFFLVIKPAENCPTAEMFSALDQLAHPFRTLEEFEEGYNDFARVAPQVCTELIARILGLGAFYAGLTGSGSAVFGRFETHTEALTALSLLTDLGHPTGHVCRTLTRAECLRVDPI